MPEPCDISILVVDDNEAKRYSVVRILRQAGFNIMEATTGEEALAMAGMRPDLMVLDVKLPGISGFEVCRRIKSDPELASIKVLHVSATYIDSDHRVEGLSHGADGYLVQPVEPGELVETVRALLRLRETEEATRRTAREWRATFDAIGSGILLVDERATILRCNRAMREIIGKPFHDIIGAPVHECLAPALVSALEPLLAETSVSYDACSHEAAFDNRQYLITVTPVIDGAGRAMGAVCVFGDVTERNRLEQELRRRAEALAQADRAKDEFLAMLGHELRNPLGAISNALEVLRSGERLSGERLSSERRSSERRAPREGLATVNRERAREILDRQVSTMSRLVDDLLDMSRVSRGKIVLRKEPLSLGEAVWAVVRNLRPQAEAKGLHLHCDADEAIVVNGDRVRLEQIITNLVANAIRYTEEGDIHVHLSRDEQNAVLTVCDTGIGIRPETLLHVFDMFTQGERSQIRTQGGLGIGLTLVRALMDLHGGTVKAESAGEGAGSTFTITLPLLDEVLIQPSEKAPEAATAECRSVLVVDDNVDGATTLAEILESWGHTATTAFDGPSALETVRRNAPEVVLLDIGLPGMSGYDVVRKLRDVPNGGDLVLIAVTGFGQAEDRQRAVEAGFDYHLAKPVNLPALREILAKATR